MLFHAASSEIKVLNDWSFRHYEARLWDQSWRWILVLTSSHIRNKPSKVDCWWRRLLPAHYGFLIHCLGGLTWRKNPSLYNRLNHDLDGQVRRLYVMRADEENPMARLDQESIRLLVFGLRWIPGIAAW